MTCVMFPVRKAPPVAARTKPALWRVSCPQALSHSATPIREMVLRRETDCHSLHGKLAFLVAYANPSLIFRPLITTPRILFRNQPLKKNRRYLAPRSIALIRTLNFTVSSALLMI